MDRFVVFAFAMDRSIEMDFAKFWPIIIRSRKTASQLSSNCSIAQHERARLLIVPRPWIKNKHRFPSTKKDCLRPGVAVSAAGEGGFDERTALS
ncbi:MAG: hypothetical protein ACREFW_05145 [Rhizomicrobium sp.]